MLIYDVFSEKVPYCGPNSVILEQLFSNFVLVFLINTAQGATIFFLYMLMSDKFRRPKSDAAHYARRLIRAYEIVFVIRYYFADEVVFISL